jgi:hypothetical protein
MSVARISAGLAVSAFFASTSFAATFVINQETPLQVAGSPGFTYLVNNGAGSLNVATEGFLFCTNIGQAQPQPVTVNPQHGSWRFPVAQDVRSVGYNSGQLKVNPPTPIPSTLVCHAVGAQGELASPMTDGIFRNYYELKTAEQFSNLINWIPSAGFSWSNPNWSIVPNDPCSPSVDQPAAVVEDVTCAAVSGQRAAGAGATMRAPTLWTGTDGSNYFYVARIDARYGPQSANPAAPATTPTLADAHAPAGTGAATIRVVDAYDSGVVGVGSGYLGDTGSWCILTSFPTALSATMCNNAPTGGLLNGPLNEDDFSGFIVGVPPLNIEQVSFYMAFVRPIIGAPPPVSEPAVAVSVHVEPSVVLEGGDAFKGDDVMFGFLPASTGFPWMTGQ